MAALSSCGRHILRYNGAVNVHRGSDVGRHLLLHGYGGAQGGQPQAEGVCPKVSNLGSNRGPLKLTAAPVYERGSLPGLMGIANIQSSAPRTWRAVLDSGFGAIPV